MKKEQLPKRWTVVDIVQEYSNEAEKILNEESDVETYKGEFKESYDKLFIEAEEYDKLKEELATYRTAVKNIEDLENAERHEIVKLKKELSELRANYIRKEEIENFIQDLERFVNWKEVDFQVEHRDDNRYWIGYECPICKTEEGLWGIYEHLKKHKEYSYLKRFDISNPQEYPKLFLKLLLSLSEPKARIEEGKYCFCKKPKEVKKG